MASDFRETFKRYGWVGALYAPVMRSLEPLLTVWRVHSRSLADTDMPELPSDIEVLVATPQDLLHAMRQDPQGLPEEFVQSAIGRGDICVMATSRGRLAAYVWRSFSAAPFEEDLWLRVRKPRRYGYKAFTVPEFRGRQLHGLVSRWSDEYCLAQGYSEAVSLIKTHNYASIRSDVAAGNELCGFVVRIKLAGWRLVWRTPGAKHLDIELFVPQQETQAMASSQGSSAPSP